MLPENYSPIDPDADLDQLVARVWGAYQKFSSFDYATAPVETASVATPTAVERSELAPDVYPRAVTEALQEIAAGAYEKIVLARGIKLQADEPWQPLHALNRLLVRRDKSAPGVDTREINYKDVS